MRRTSTQRHRTWISVPLTPAERQRAVVAAGGPATGRKGQGYGILIASVILAFESLDRADQVRAILAVKVNHTWGDKDTWGVPAHPFICQRLHAWNFRAVSQGGALRGALLHFLQLPAAEQREWRDEAFLFLSTNETVVPA